MCWSCNGARHDTEHPFPHQIRTSALPPGQLVRGEEGRVGGGEGDMRKGKGEEGKTRRDSKHC